MVLSVFASCHQVQGNPQQVADNQFLFVLESPDSVRHIVVFMTGEVPFSDGFGGAIYMGWPGGGESGAEVAWQYLGFVANDKPSAIFKVSKGPFFSFVFW